MSLDSLETSIQKLLSELYPPFEATAPTLLSQLFQLIDSRYKGDALRCLLDFLVPAKHILDTVRQAACALYSDLLFLCEGWPLCLRDQVVIHLAPINPLLLQPGDFYLKVAPFCDQSARIVICSLLEEEGLAVELVEETPIPETHCPCLFSSDWLKDINQGRHGAPLRQYLVATEQGIVRLPWEKVAVPEFVEVPQCVGSSMASVSPSFPPPQPSLTSSLPNFSKDSSHGLFSLPHTKESAPTQCNVTVQNSLSSTSAQPPAFTVETRISPAKHGIAVSLCLVGTSGTSSSKLVRLKDTDAEPKPIGWVSPNTWDSRVTGSEPVTTTSAYQPVCEDLAKCADKSLVNENIVREKDTITHLRDINQSVPQSQAAAGGEYIDIMQATMLFSKAQCEQQKSVVQTPMEAQIQICPQRPAQMQPRAQLESFRPSGRRTNTLLTHQEQSPAHMQFHPHPQPYNPHRSEAPAPTLSTETGCPSAPHHSQSHRTQLDPVEPSQCVRTVRFSEKPCTPCMKRRQIGKVPQPQELRCRYRDSYQAAIKNPVAFGQEIRRGNMSTVLEEDGDSSPYVDRHRPPGTETEGPWCSVQGVWCDPGINQQPTLIGDICKESGEQNTAHYWRARDPQSLEYMEANTMKYSDLPDQLTIKHCLALRDPVETNSAKHGNEKYSETGKEIHPEDLSSSNSPQQSHVRCAKHPGLQFDPSETSGTPQERLRTVPNCLRTSPTFSKSAMASQNRPESVSDGRCSSLSTTVVDTSEKCEVVIVEGRNVRRKESKNSCAEVPQLHVVKCKNSTAFGLVSPKMSRRRTVVPDVSPTSRTCQQIETSSQAVPPSAAGTQKIFHPVSAAPRPHHLPLGPPDPGAHPLFLGVASLTGGRDRTGRPIVELYGEHPGWRSAVTRQQICQMLLYFHLITRREIREAGMTLIFDGRKTNPQPQLYQALMTLQEQSPQVLNSVVLLVSKDTSRGAERCPGIQTVTVSSMKALLKLVEVSHLSSHLDGSLCHSHLDWLELHQKLFPFVSDLHEASGLLLSTIRKLEEPQRTDTVQNVQQCMMDQKTLMKDVLEESKLVSLQREGGSILARLRRESDLKYPHCDSLSDAVDSVTSLYNHMEEQVHILVHNSNVSLEHLEYLKQLRGMEDHFTQMQQWYNVEGERHLLEAESVDESGDRLEQILNSFTGFLIEANDRRHHAMSLVSEAEHLQRSGSSYSETETFKSFVQAFRSDLEKFLCRAEVCGRDLQIMVNVCDFCEQAVTLANECIDYLDQRPTNPRLTQCQSQEIANNSLCPSNSKAPGTTQVSTDVSANDKDKLLDFQDRFLQFSLEKFQEIKVQASGLHGSRGMRVWNVAWLRCQEAQQQLQERIQDAQQNPESNQPCECHYIDVVSTTSTTTSPSGQNLVVQSIPGTQHPQWEDFVAGVVDLGKRKPLMGSNNTNSTNIACCNIIIKPEENSDAGTSQGSKATPQSPNKSTRGTEREVRRRQSSRARRERDAAALSQSHTVGCQWFPWARGLKARSISQDSCTTAVATAGSSTPPEQGVRSPSSCSHHGQPSCRILKEAQKFQISRHGSFCSQDSCMSEKGAAGGERTSCSSLPVRRYEGTFCLTNTQESSSTALRLQRVLEELVVTEREYVRSLNYILTHYFPLLDRQDIPQDLRGKRGIIFGNLEKLHNFHSHYFLPELEECQREPAMVARCFLRHSESFGLYALYSKNKPQSDALILHRRHDIFKRKQQELGDMMDLSSYLLRPIQRISKYSLLLQDMLALAGSYRPKDMIQDRLLRPSVSTQNVCGPGAYVPDLTSGERERERAEIQSAADLVRFQMRHGNDLLTMDAIRDCDVNLKEQGQLIRQDEFTVFFRKKKCVRRVFLFEDLILFSKTKKTDVGNDVYVYKQSFKTSDIGMTHNSVVGSLCFEIWFRRRKSEDTYTLKATSMEGKKAWTTDLERILWDQAAHSRELRMQERVFMGMGRKPFMDIQPSDAAICDRAVNCVLPGRIPVACCSHRSLDFPRPHSIGSGSTASTTLSQSSSSSGRGSLPPAGYPGNLSQGVEPSPTLCSSHDALMDNELNSHHLHQHLHDNCEHWKRLHPLIDSTTSSSECINLISMSDHSCLSAPGVDTVDDNSSSLAPQCPKLRPPLCQTPSLRRNDSPVISRKKLGVAPQPPHLVKAQSDDMIISKSTEV